jgi:predicted transposase YbfD/YdcC
MKVEHIIVTTLQRVYDYRVANRCSHRLESILFIAICTILSGGEDYHDMEAYGQEKEKWLGKYLDLPYGTPSHDTFERVFQNLDKEDFSKYLSGISYDSKLDLQNEIVAIDGKKLRGVSPKTRGNRGLYILSAWACKEEVSLGEIRVEDKSNEITSIPSLLEKIEIKESLISIDAMGCQKEIATLILGKEADYLLALKSNQKSLEREVQEIFAYVKTKQEDAQWDYGHGRYEERKCYILDAQEYLSPMELTKWKGIRTLIRIDSLRIQDDIRHTETRYYISSRVAFAKYFNDAVRIHWSIENKLHWNLDTILKEDSSRARLGNSPENLNILRKFCLRLLVQKKDGFSKNKKRFKAALNTQYLQGILNVNV